MPHNLDLIDTLTGGLTAALLFGHVTQRLRLSPIVGDLLAGSGERAQAATPGGGISCCEADLAVP